MANKKATLTKPLVIAVVLVLGLLTAASAGLFKGAQDGGSVGSVADVDGPPTTLPMPNNRVPEGDMPQTLPMPGDDMPRTLPMPPRDSNPERAPEVNDRHGVTHEQLALLLADNFSTGDVDRHVHEHPDGTVRPDELVTRADVALAIVGALDLEPLAAAHAPAESRFRDVPVGHRAFAAVAMLERLGMYPFHVGTLFAPDERIELAEVNHAIGTARRLESAHGPIVHVNAPARTVSVEREARHAIAYIAGEHTLIVRNDAPVTVEQLQPGDDVRLFADDTGELLVAVAIGPGQPATATNEAVALMRELATPEQLAAIIARDWDKAAVELRSGVYNQLLERGVTAEEATALLAQDWPVVEEQGKVRLTEVIAGNTDVNEELVRAVLDQDWDTALSHVEVEVLEYLLNYLMV